MKGLGRSRGGSPLSLAVRRGGGERRRSLAREVAKRALLEARRNGLDAEELVMAIQKLVAEEERAEARLARKGDDE